MYFLFSNRSTYWPIQCLMQGASDPICGGNYLSLRMPPPPLEDHRLFSVCATPSEFLDHKFQFMSNRRSSIIKELASELQVCDFMSQSTCRCVVRSSAM